MAILEQCLFHPSSTPRLSEPLSVIDRLTGPVCIGGIYYFSGQPDFPRLKNALREALNLYPWLAGRLASEGHSLEVQYPGNGLMFTLSDGDAEPPSAGLMLEPGQAMSLVDAAVDAHDVVNGDSPLTFIRVTRMRHGGFALGVRNVHCIADGVGFSRFLSAWSALYRGERPALPGWYSRATIDALAKGSGMQPSSALHVAPSPNFDVRECLRSRQDNFSSVWIQIPAEALSALVQRARRQAAMKLSSSDVLHGLLWRGSAKASVYACEGVYRIYSIFDFRRVEGLGIPPDFSGNALMERRASYSLSGLIGCSSGEAAMQFRQQTKPLSSHDVCRDIAFFRRELRMGRIDTRTGRFDGFMRQSVVDCLEGRGVYVNDMRHLCNSGIDFGCVPIGYEILPAMGWPFAGVYSLQGGGVGIRYVGWREQIPVFSEALREAFEDIDELDIQRAFIALSSP